MSYCATCELIARRDAGQAPLWDCIHRTRFWDVVHSFNSSLPGWLVLVARRHIAALDEMQDAEAAELGILLQQVSLALKAIVGCSKTYVLQFAEAPGHAHVHVHVVPRMDDQPLSRRGVGIMMYLGVPEAERVPEDEMNRIAAEVQRFLQRPFPPLADRVDVRE